MENLQNAVQQSPMRAAFEAYFVNPIERNDIPEFWEDWQAAWNAALEQAALRCESEHKRLKNIAAEDCIEEIRALKMNDA